jgi:hypothetical protein
MRVPLVAVTALLAALSADSARAECAGELEVVGASVSFATRLFQGRPTRRDATVTLELRSTSTTALSAVELGIFLGASMKAMDQTRASALPTQQPRLFPDGGLAFRARVDVVLPPGATRTVEVVREAVPLDQDVYGVRAVVVGCARTVAVDSQVQLAVPDAAEDPPAWLLGAAVLLTLAAAVVVLRRAQ